MVSSVEPGGAADKAGIRPNDIVIAFGEHPVTSIDVLHKLLSDEHADVKTAGHDFARNGKARDRGDARIPALRHLEAPVARLGWNLRRVSV